MNNSHIKIVDARYLSDYKIELQFGDNTLQQIDFGLFLKNHPHTQHDKYNNLQNFRKFKVEAGNIVWGRNWDLIFDPYKLYKGIDPS